ncbi:beta-1,4-glucuronyltransferase 1-like [Oratosquilla oratoria]|uniref:beta-1,4-glucuronyltransferase 1-like n=1 Tax=Oratosquilla oratoria TaxID=337810 RepID=UPI003F76A3A1
MVGARRSVLVRGSLVLNAVFLVYLAQHVVQPPSATYVFPASLRASGANSPDNLTAPNSSTAPDYADTDSPSGGSGSVGAGGAAPSSSSSAFQQPPPAPPPAVPSLQEKVYPDLHKCATPALKPRAGLHGEYWVLYNYVPADTQPLCNESVTYTTHGDFTFLDNLVPLVERWRGPISAALYAPGSDFNATLKTIAFLRTCRPLVATHVTFHVFFPADHMPAKVPPSHLVSSMPSSCKGPLPFAPGSPTYKATNNLTYPVNVARNLARTSAATYFVLASDVELYPSQYFIPHFMAMLRSRDASPSAHPQSRVYVLPIFEVKAGLRAPATKASLVRMLQKGLAIPFHKFVCSQCHMVPGAREWLEAGFRRRKAGDIPVGGPGGGMGTNGGVRVRTVAKRHPPFHRWEPIYVGTNRDPLYEERLTWEGRSDKMTQMYVLCVLDYEFHILDTAFLVHRPGIKRHKRDKQRDLLTARQNILLNTKIKPELDVIYGKRPSCTL